jgi:hypothetical protein
MAKPSIFEFPTAVPFHVWQFEHATVQYSEHFSLATDRPMPKLSVMCIDQYRYQREFSVSFRWEPGDSKSLFWEMSVYQHPGRRETERVSEAVAVRFIKRFIEQVEKHPDLLFNSFAVLPTNSVRPRAEGFVHLCERLHRGAALSSKLLD